jgi:Holliday junction endodeoxyribonuclease RuvC-like protein
LIEQISSIIGIDPGVKNPGAVELCRFPHGWTAISVPLLHSFEELDVWLVERMRNPPISLRLVGVESVQGAVWGHLQRETTNFHALKIIQCKGTARLFAAFHGVPCVEVAPATMRSTVVGNGLATKEQMREVIRRTVRGWPEKSNMNQTDAAAVALTAVRRTLPDALARQMRMRP